VITLSPNPRSRIASHQIFMPIATPELRRLPGREEGHDYAQTIPALALESLEK